MELEKRMNISKIAASELVEEMNNSVFRKIREELIKTIERKKVSTQKPQNTSPILTQKLTTHVQTPITKTDHTVNNMSSSNASSKTIQKPGYAVDPYRMIPE